VQPFARGADGTLVVALPNAHRQLLDLVLTDVRRLIDGPELAGRVRDRLYPSAYLDPTEDTAEQDWQNLVHHDLVQGKVAAIDGVRAALRTDDTDAEAITPVVLESEQEEQLLGALNDVRLVLAELVAGAGDTGATADPHAIDPSDLLEWLGALESELIELKLGDFAPD